MGIEKWAAAFVRIGNGSEQHVGTIAAADGAANETGFGQLAEMLHAIAEMLIQGDVRVTAGMVSWLDTRRFGGRSRPPAVDQSTVRAALAARGH